MNETRRSSGPFRAGDRVQLTGPKGRMNTITLEPGKLFHSHRGVLEHDAKRIRVYLEMYADEGGEPVSASEQLMLHVDRSGPRAAPFDADVLARVAALRAAAAGLEEPRYLARPIGLTPPRLR